MKILLLIACIVVLSCGGSNPEEVERVIKGSERLTAVDQFCMNVPKPADFTLVSKAFAGSSGAAAIAYGYKTKFSLTEVKEFYQRYFDNPNNLIDIKSSEIRDAQIIYRFDKRIIWIEYLASNTADYVITCKEKRD